MDGGHTESVEQFQARITFSIFRRLSELGLESGFAVVGLVRACRL